MLGYHSDKKAKTHLRCGRVHIVVGGWHSKTEVKFRCVFTGSVKCYGEKSRTALGEGAVVLSRVVEKGLFGKWPSE